MTTKPKARKFRIRRVSSSDASQSADAALDRPEHESDAQRLAADDGPATTTPEAHSARSAADHGAETSGETSVPSAPPSTNIEEIRKEGLTGRQLRMARRLAQRQGLSPSSDFEAVQQLRERGIDPFQRSNIVELISKSNGRADGANGDEGTPRIQLPQTVPADRQKLPSEDLSPADRRARDIQSIQRDIATRRRRKTLMLLSRLMAFVMLPTLVAGYYFYAIATPMYSTKSEFLILTADGTGGGAASSLLSGTAFATGQDSIATQSYLQSKDAMLRLDADLGFKSHFGDPSIDPIQRLDPDASTEDAHALYKKYIKLGFDPTEGVIRMEISTADPEVSRLFSQQLIEYAEERVDQLSQEKRFDAVKTAEQSLNEAKEDRRSAQRRLVELQEGTILDPEGEIANIRSLISNAELQLQEKLLALNTQLANARPNEARVAALRSEVDVLEAELVKQNARLTQATVGSASLASQAAEIQMAQADLMTADMVLQSALETKRQSEVEANKQVRYLTVAVEPVASEDPTYPRSFENTLLTFLLFAGIYLLISLTVSVLREQVSS
ncbi:MAG: capsule biosynthesis protein [Pseudomonadota bacterium]